MTRQFKKHQEEKWKKMAKMWEEFTDPGRPGTDDCKKINDLIKNILKSRKNASVLILGSTPEFRDLMYKYSAENGAAVVCLDMSQEMYMAMSHFTERKNKKEKFIQGDWLERKIASNSFDVILGDLVLGNITFEKKEIFLQNIIRMLKKNGYFISRVAHANKKSDMNFKNLIESYYQEMFRNNWSIKQTANYLALDMLYGSKFLNPSNLSVLKCWQNDLDEYKKLINKKTDAKSELIKDILNELKISWWPLKNRHWYFLRKDENEKLLNKYFVIKNKLTTDYGYKLCCETKIYALQNK